MRVFCQSGRELDIPAHHRVFVPLGDYEDGDAIDPATVEFVQRRASVGIREGTKIIVDNRVEVIAAVEALVHS